MRQSLWRLRELGLRSRAHRACPHSLFRSGPAPPLGIARRPRGDNHIKRRLVFEPLDPAELLLPRGGCTGIGRLRCQSWDAVPSRLRGSSDRDDELAAYLAGGELPHGLGGLAERVGPLDGGNESAFLDQGREALEERVVLLRREQRHALANER